MKTYIITEQQLKALTSLFADLPYRVANAPMQLLNHITVNQAVKDQEPPAEDHHVVCPTTMDNKD